MARKSKSSAIALSVQLGADHEPPTEFRIFRAGENPSEKGTFIFDAKAAESVMANYAKHGKALRFDYNHAVTFAEPTPDQAIAAGSFVPEVRPGEGGPELWACQIKWTERAASYLRAGEYCEMSPLFEHDGDGRVLRLLNVALTNLPALDNTIPLVAASANEGDDPMEKCAACSAKDKDMDDLRSKMSALSSKLAALEAKYPEEAMSALTALRTEVTAITGNGDVAVAIGTLRAMKAQADEGAALKARVATETEAARTSKFNGLIDEAIAKCIVSPAEKDAFRASYLDDGKITEFGVKALSAFVERSKPAVVTDATRATAPAASSAVPSSQQAMAKAMGIDVSAFAQTRAAT